MLCIDSKKEQEAYLDLLRAEDHGRRLLYPLLKNQSVFLYVNETCCRIPKRYERPVLLIVPVDDGLVFSIPGLRSEFLKVDRLLVSSLCQVGLTPRAARLLIDAIKDLYEVRKNGQKTPNQKRKRRRRKSYTEDS